MRPRDSDLNQQLGFAPTAYPADLSATITALAVDLTAQAGKAIRVRNMDAVNQIRIAFGTTSALAISNQ